MRGLNITRKRLWGYYFPLAIGLFFFVYIVIRAAVIPITCDEANTCLTFSVTSVRDIVTYHDPVPNNHILNTLLIKGLTEIFGMHVFVARLPNVLAFLLYFFVLFSWLRAINPYPLFVLAGIVIFCCNPYLIDFFSLARGYALSIACMITSAWLAWRWLGTRSLRLLTASLVWAALGVYANFTILNYYAALVVVLTLVILQGERISTFRRKAFLRILCVSGLLALCIFYPLYRIASTRQLVYWHSNGFYADSMQTLIHDSQYALRYGPVTDSTFTFLFTACMMLIAVAAVIRLVRVRFRLADAPFAVMCMLVFGTALANIAQCVLLKVPYVDNRTALFYYPLAMIALIFFLQWLFTLSVPLTVAVSVLLVLFGTQHMIRAADFTQCHDWWYDRDDTRVLADLDHLGKPLQLDAYWIFYPSLHFYLATASHPDIRLRDYHQALDPDSPCDYYYLNATDTAALQGQFTLYRSYNYGKRVLMVRKFPAGDRGSAATSLH